MFLGTLLTSERLDFQDGCFLVCNQKDEKGKPWCSNSRRLEYITATRQHGFLDDEQVAMLRAVPTGDEELESARRASQEAYRAAFSFLTDEGRAQKAMTANQTYGLFRGLAMACAVVAALFLLILVVGFARSYGELGDLLRMWQGFAELVLYPLIAISAFSYAAISFRLRARNRGKHHVREVLDSLVATSSLEQEVAGS